MCGYASAEAIALLVAALLALGGCQPQAAGGEFEINAVEARWANGRMNVHTEQVLRLSDSARQALGHGVPLTVEIELILRSTVSQTRVAHELSAYEIRYLPMSEHYRVTRLDSADPYSATDLISLTKSDLIETGSNQKNVIGIKAVGKKFTIFANGYQIAEIKDASFSQGRYGLFVQAVDTANYTYRPVQIVYWDLSE